MSNESQPPANVEIDYAPDPDALIDGEPVVAIGPRSGLRYTHIVARWAIRLEEIELASYPTADPADLYDRNSLRLLAADFPNGCFAGFDGDEMVAMGLGLRTPFDVANPQHTIDDIVPPDGAASGHDPNGPWYYGTGISVTPEYRRRGIGAELYGLRKQVCRRLGLKGIVAGGVMPGFVDHKHAMSADDYINKVASRELYDRTLTFQLDNGFVLGPALSGYITDPAVDDFASFIVWHNDTTIETNDDSDTSNSAVDAT